MHISITALAVACSLLSSSFAQPLSNVNLESRATTTYKGLVKVTNSYGFPLGYLGQGDFLPGNFLVGVTYNKSRAIVVTFKADNAKNSSKLEFKGAYPGGGNPVTIRGYLQENEPDGVPSKGTLEQIELSLQAEQGFDPKNNYATLFGFNPANKRISITWPNGPSSPLTSVFTRAPDNPGFIYNNHLYNTADPAYYQQYYAKTYPYPGVLVFNTTLTLESVA